MSFNDRRLQRGGPQPSCEESTTVRAEEVDENRPEGEWEDNPDLFHRTNDERIMKIERDGFLDPEKCTMKYALCEHCSWGVCFSVVNSYTSFGPHIFSGPQLEVLSGDWYCYALKREGGYEYRAGGYSKPYVTLLFSRNPSPPCKHFSKTKARDYALFVGGMWFFNTGLFAITIMVQERVELFRLGYKYENDQYF